MLKHEHKNVSCYTRVELMVQWSILGLDLIQSRQAALLTGRLQAAVWFCLALSTCPWVTSCKKGDGSADTSKKAAFLKCEFACFAWNWCIRTLIHPLSTEYSSNSLFCKMKPRSIMMHPSEVLDVTGLGDILLLSFPRKAFWSHQNVIGK